METKIKIDVPDGMEIDMSSIKFKPIEKKRFIDDEDAIIEGYYIRGCKTLKIDLTFRNKRENFDIFATEKQAKSALAMARISQIMANDERFGGVVTDEEWSKQSICKYCIERTCINLDVSVYTSIYRFLAFHTKEQRDLFLKENEQLVKDYLMFD